MPSVNRQATDDAAPDEGLRHLDEGSRDRLRDLQPANLPIQSLRRTGQRPYAFNGAAVATVCGVTPLLPYWYELNLHRTVLGTCVSDVRLFNKSADQADVFRVVEHDDLNAASDYFERYDPSADIAPPAELLIPGSSNTQLALHTARLQMQVNQLTDHYRAMAGALLDVVQNQVG